MHGIAQDGVNSNSTHIGNLANLDTASKENLVGAINEVNEVAIETRSVAKVEYITGQEVATNEFLDGKQIYAKRINLGNLPNNGFKNVSHNISNFNLVRFTGTAKDSASGNIYPLPFSWAADASYDVGIIVTDNNVTIETKRDVSTFVGYCILYYTKN